MKEYLSFRNVIALILLGGGFPIFAGGLTSSTDSIFLKFETSNDWIGFFGSYTGAILGGIITLIVMNVTIKSSEENLKKTIAENKIIEERKERIEFCNGIAKLISNFCSESRKYRYLAKRIEKSSDDMVKLHEVFIKRKLDLAKNKEKENSDEECNQMDQESLNEKYVHVELSELEYKEEKARFDDILQQMQKLNTVQLYFELNVKLENIEDSKGLIEKINIVNKLGGSSVPQQKNKLIKYYDKEFEIAIQDLLKETTNFIGKYTSLT
ncbi:Uncharacterised protein [[Clostridium] sordellii]|uniref:Uncharacterized protein n=1 Tax=Paraclostridium sordellii TaxID=1505 RepID=A0A0C7R4C7_PARSO|nr:hypothetical protein [Paeniclostridium sordellii]CEQ04098.1 Uncharacterised protein [[Clostridium] sordellii] [Paeniclostridium sordellii]